MQGIPPHRSASGGQHSGPQSPPSNRLRRRFVCSVSLLRLALIGSTLIHEVSLLAGEPYAAISPNHARALANLPPDHPLTPAVGMAQEALAKVNAMQDYDCQFVKRELIDNRLQTQVIYMRLREEPFSIYMKFGEPHAGREVMYVAGRNNNQMLAHEGSGFAKLVGTLSLALDDPKTTAENRHPLNEAGLKNMLKLLIAQWELETKYGEIEVQQYVDARIGKTRCHVVEAVHPQPRNQFRFHITRLYIDSQTGLPLRLENYGWPPRAGAAPILVEEYTYGRVRPNLGLTDSHFDTRNPEYAF